jgi:small subunit ribosomal protein S16
MLSIRLQRTGRKNDPAFRIVVCEHTEGPKSNSIVEKLGSHHPKTKVTEINAERVQYWISVGAQASGTVHNMLVTKGIVKGKKINVLPKKSAPKKVEAPAA